MKDNEIGVVNKAFEGSSENVVDDKKHEINSESTENRPKWGNELEFLMSCVSMSVGLGNIWRFPFTAYENGGGAFLIPYIIVLLLIGRPIYYMEMALGQFISRGSVKSWNCAPALKGIAIGQSFGTLLVNSYYCSLIALTLFYMIKSFTVELPWAHCWKSWEEDCVDSASFVAYENRSKVTFSSSELYFTKEVIQEKNHIEDGIGTPILQLSMWLLFAWSCVFLVIVKGVKSSGKISYFLAIFPYVIMLILLVRICTLDGAYDGIIYFFAPDFSKLLEPTVWYNSMTQMFFSLSAGMGPIIIYASYNQFDHDIAKDALIVTSVDTCTSILGGTVIFGILGNLAHNLGEPDISNVIKGGGSSLAFISYPDAISKFEFVPQLFSILFFFMLFVLGVGCAVGYQSSIITNITDSLPKRIKYWYVAGSACAVGFFIGLMYVTPGGQWMFTLVDFGGTFLIFPLAVLQVIGVFWVYGLENFCLDLEFMVGRRISPFWRISWGIVTPVFMIIIFIYSILHMENPTYSIYEFPNGYVVGMWSVVSLGVIIVVLIVFWTVLINSRNTEMSKAVKKSFSPSSEWGPANQEVKEKWLKYKSDFMEKRDIVIETQRLSRYQQIVYTLLGKYNKVN